MRQQSLFDQEWQTKWKGEYDDISAVDQLTEAYKMVKANKGAPGVDGVTIESFGNNLESELNRLSTELREWRYTPKAVRRVLIPKPGSQDKRELGIPTVRDRIVQQSIRLSIEDRFEQGFSKSSFGFRPGRGQQDAIQQAQTIVNSGKEWIVDIDLEKFFNRINKGMVTIARKSIQRAMAKVRELTPRATHLPLKKRLEKINQWYTGWVGYYKMTEFPSQLHAIEAHIRRRLRSQFIGEQKRKRHLYRKLLSLGVTKKQARQIYKHKGRWALSHCFAVQRAYSNKWFEEAGLRIKSHLNLPHWKPISTRII